MSLVDLVVDVHHQLVASGLSHAFGGALALAYVAEPRGTVDVDVNVFAPSSDVDSIVDAFGALGLRPERPRREWLPIAGIRVRSGRDPYPVDIFPSLDERYGEVERRCVTHAFGPGRVLLPFLSAEDLALFKLSFGRDKDWVDLRSIATSFRQLDVDYIEEQLIGLRGPTMYPRIARLRTLIRDD